MSSTSLTGSGCAAPTFAHILLLEAEQGGAGGGRLHAVTLRSVHAVTLRLLLASDLLCARFMRLS